MNPLREAFEQPVTLLDGTVVGSWSQEWLHECEALTVLRMPSKAARIAHLRGAIDPVTGDRKGGLVKKRGLESVEKLENTIMALWRAGRR